MSSTPSPVSIEPSACRRGRRRGSRPACCTRRGAGPGLVEPQAVRTVLAARRLPRRDGLLRCEVDREREVLVLEVRVEAAALVVGREALGLAVEGEPRLLRRALPSRIRIELVTRRRHPDLLGLRDVGEAVGHRIERVARALRERLLIERADREVTAVADVDGARRRGSPSSARRMRLLAVPLHLLRSEARRSARDFPVATTTTSTVPCCRPAPTRCSSPGRTAGSP